MLTASLAELSDQWPVYLIESPGQKFPLSLFPLTPSRATHVYEAPILG